jgi:hypothetical protein
MELIPMTQPDGARPDLLLEGHIPPDRERRYLSVPFAVPPGVGQLIICYDYSDRIASDPDLAGGSTLDIGLFDERGDEAGGPGFRGWSGSARRQFTVGERWATPPYRPGPTRAGQWSVLLGPYKVPSHGTDYRVEITFSGEQSAELPPEAAAPPLAALPARTMAPPAESGWVRADLHSHTVFSDGDSWPAETIAAAWAAGLDVVGITDHNSAISAADYAAGLAGGPLLVPGVEMTTYGGHWNAWAAPGVTGHRWYDFREPDQASTERAMAAAVADGALVSINHPKPLGPMWEYPGVRSFHAVEVWNGAWPKLNAAALAYWEALLRAGHRVTVIGGSDTHRLRDSRRPRFGFPEAQFGQPTTFLRTGDGPPTIAAVHAAIRRGDVFITESPDGPELYVHQNTEDGIAIHVVGARGDTLSVIGPDGAVHAAAVPADDWTTGVAWPIESPWLRVQISDRLGQMRALSNAVWR